MRSLFTAALVAAFALTGPAADAPTAKAVAVALALANAPAEPPPTAKAVAVALAMAGATADPDVCVGDECGLARTPPAAGPGRFAVRLHVVTDRGPASGSGTVVNSPAGPVVLTAKHVVEGAVALAVMAPNGRWYPATVLATDPAADLAAVSWAGGPGFAEVGEGTNAGERVRMFGHPMARPLQSPKSGTVVGLVGLSVGGVREGFNAGLASEPGDSGAGVFDDAGKVVGVVILGTTPASAAGIAERAVTVRKFLATVTAPKPMPAAKADAPKAVAPKLTLTRVTADWCVPCHRLKVSLADTTVAAELARFEVKVADVTKDTPLLSRLAPNGIPALIVTDAAGNEVGRTAGYLTPPELAGWLRQFGK